MMLKRLSTLLAVSLVLCVSLVAQQSQPLQPLTLWHDFTVNAGKEDEFMVLVKTVGVPVLDKLMADGVVQAWGVEVPILRMPGQPTHTVWITVNDWAGVGKVQDAIAAQFAKLAAEEAKAGKRPAMTTAQRVRDVFDASKTRDWLTRDLVSGYGTKMPANAMPYTRYFFAKAKPGKGGEYRKVWEKYNKLVLEKLVTDGVVMAWGLGVEEVKTDGTFTHYTWVGVAEMGDWDKVRAAFVADRDRRSEEERAAIGDAFNDLTDADAARGLATRSIVFHVPAPK
jgi:hypothetical protein